MTGWSLLQYHHHLVNNQLEIIMANVTIQFDPSTESVEDVLTQLKESIACTGNCDKEAFEHVIVKGDTSSEPILGPLTPVPPSSEVFEHVTVKGDTSSEPVPRADLVSHIPNDLAQFVEEVDVEDVPNIDLVLDKEGLPWDERIHSSSRSQTQGGVWTKRRGVSETLVTQVKEELRQAMYGAPAPEPVVEAPPEPTSDWTWVEVLSTVTKAQQAGTVSAKDTHAAHTALGVGEFAELITREDLWGSFMSKLGLTK